MAWLQVYRPRRVRRGVAYSSRERFQDFRTDDLWRDGRQGTCFSVLVSFGHERVIRLLSNASGYGYQVRIVSDLPNIDNDLAASFDWALKEIRSIQSAARSGKPILKPRWPVIILRTPKGLSGPKSVHGQVIEGSFRSHQVPLPLAKTSAEELDILSEWLKSYKPKELFNSDGAPVDDILKLIPERNDKKLGQRHEAYLAYTPLQVPEWRSLAVERGTQESCMQRVGQFLRDVIVE